MTGFSVRGADGALYHTTTSAAARLGVSYDTAKALIASGRIASVSAESVGARVNKPGARLVSEAALAAYQRGGDATVVEMPTAVVNAGGVPIAPAGAGYDPPAQSKPKRGDWLGCVGGIAFLLAPIVIVAILGSSDSDMEGIILSICISIISGSIVGLIWFIVGLPFNLLKKRRRRRWITEATPAGKCPICVKAQWDGRPPPNRILGTSAIALATRSNRAGDRCFALLDKRSIPQATRRGALSHRR